jgi:hypothetical protein
MASRIPVRTPVFDDTGNLTRPWLAYLNSLDTSQPLSDVSVLASLEVDNASAFAKSLQGVPQVGPGNATGTLADLVTRFNALLANLLAFGAIK